MSTLSVITYHFFIFTFITLNSNLIFSFHHQSLNQTSNFDPDTLLSGDAELIEGVVHLNRQINSSRYGSIRQSKKHIKFIKSNNISISTDFTFSISGNGRGLCFEIKTAKNWSEERSGISKYIGIRFNGNHVGVEVGDRNGKLWPFDMFFNSGEKFHSWVDYEASSKQIEIRVGKPGNRRPYIPILMYPIDLSEMWKDEEVFVGLSSSGDNNVVQSVNVYSWRFRVRAVPKSLHSKPMNPEGIINRNFEQEKEEKKRSCHLGILTFGCGALAAVVLLSLWKMFVKRYDSMTPAENNINPLDFRYLKIGVDVENVFEDVKK